MPKQAPELNVKSIHEVIASITLPENISEKIVETNNTLYTNDENYDNALQAIETMTRPTGLGSIKEIGNVLLKAVITAGEDAQKWKFLVMTILRKRYHMKSPEARSIKKEINDAAAAAVAANNNKNDKDGIEEEAINEQAMSGHGERMVFYIFFMCLYRLSCLTLTSADKNLYQIPSFISDFSTKAVKCIGRLTVAAGGTRDICTLLEYLVYDNLSRSGTIALQDDKGNKRAISAAVIDFILSQKEENKEESGSTGGAGAVLNEFVKAAADLLDGDFSLITALSAATTADESDSLKKGMRDTGIQSTINTFLPHHNRGTKGRRLAQSIAELMIWTETKHSKTNSKFIQAFTDIHNCSSSIVSTDASSDDKIVASLHVIQTSIRRFRKVLNESSRKQGFSLCTSFAMEPSSITLSMVKCGKEGDVLCLRGLATKKSDKRVMQLIANRSADPSKAIPIQSIRQLCDSWLSLDASSKSDDEELTSLRLKIQEATVIATIKLLESKLPKTTSQKEVVLASLDGKIKNDCAAVLVAAAINPNCQWDDKSKEKSESEESRKITLFIGDERCSVSTPTDVFSLLDKICSKETGSDASSTPATTKDVQNLIDRHLGTKSHLLLFTSTDIKMEQRVLTNLQLEGSTIHCHLMDDFQSRMEREKAKVGDITITLVWDNECDLDLHCICPNGDHIYFSQKYGGGDIGGGYLDVDMNVNGQSKEPVENIFFGDAEKGIQACKGKYKVIVQNFAYHGSIVKRNDPVPWKLRVTKNGEICEYSGECKGTREASNVTAVEFEYTGRKAPLPEKVGSALSSSNLVSVTSSTGGTIDSLSGLLSVVEEHDQLTNVQNLVSNDETEAGSDAVEIATEAPSTSNDTNTPRPFMADTKSFDVTNRDRLYLHLSKLPKLFHLEVNRCFEGCATLMDYTASELAKRLISDGIPVEELKKAGYQAEIVQIVTEKMRKFGM
jgi:hypothetical protein